MTTPTPPKPGYKKTKIGWIPEDWDIVKIKNIANFLDEQRKPIKDEQRKRMQGKYPYYGASGIIDYVNDYLFDEDLILLGEDGANILMRSTPLAFRVSGKIWVNNHAHVLKPNSNIDIGFLTEFLESINYKKFNTGTAQPKLNKEVCRNIPVLLPPLPEQQKIAQILSTWDTAIEKTRALIAAKEQHKKALMQQLLTGKTRFREFVKSEEKQQTRIGECPKDWILKKADEIFNNTSTKNNRNEELLAVTQENGVVPRNMLDGRVMMPDGNTNSYKLVEPGNFVISLRSFQGGIEFSNYRGIVSPAYTVLKQIIPISVEYFKYFFKSTEFISRLSIAVIGIRDGKQISFSDFSAMTFRFPSLPEQQKIATVLQTSDREIEVLNQKLHALLQQKKGLMQQLLTGQVRVKI